jgi:hypothetical protein
MAGASLSAQPRDEGACRRQLSFIKRRTRRIATIAHRFKRRHRRDRAALIWLSVVFA